MRAFDLRVSVATIGGASKSNRDQRARPTALDLPPDIGSAAFGLAATAIHPSDVLFRGLPAPEQMPDHPEGAFMRIVGEMGLPMEYDAREQAVRVRHDGIELRALRIDCRDIPDMLPIPHDARDVREGRDGLGAHPSRAPQRIGSRRSDAAAQQNGGCVELHDDRLVARGVCTLAGANLSSFNDHRILMSLAVAATRAEGTSTLTYPNAYRISYPRFLEAMRSIGLAMSISRAPDPAAPPNPRCTAWCAGTRAGAPTTWRS